MYYLKYAAISVFVLMPSGLWLLNGIISGQPIAAQQAILSIVGLCVGKLLLKIVQRQRWNQCFGESILTKREIYAEARKTAGLFVFYSIVALCVLVYPAHLNTLLGVSDLVPNGENLNGPNDLTFLIRTLLGVISGGLFTAITWKVLGILFPTSVLGKAASSADRQK
ncbi:hypothetical protein ACF8FF_07070 [Pseudomonas sp. zjy_13]|uniref:hypothetical protein n=1 Tax=Pseudomonas sp. zjy_13 TaxID=3367263 RepID=UPI00370B96FE